MCFQSSNPKLNQWLCSVTKAIIKQQESSAWGSRARNADNLTTKWIQAETPASIIQNDDDRPWSDYIRTTVSPSSSAAAFATKLQTPKKIMLKIQNAASCQSACCSARVHFMTFYRMRCLFLIIFDNIFKMRYKIHSLGLMGGRCRTAIKTQTLWWSPVPYFYGQSFGKVTL